MDSISQSPPLHCPSCGQIYPGPVIGSQQQPYASASTSELQKLLDELDGDLQKLLGRRKGKVYSNVKVLFLNWKECNLDPQVRDETIQLQEVFRERYHFDAGDSHDIYQIPSKLSADELEIYIQKALLDFKKVDAEQDKLMIVYYNGHGRINPKTRGLMIAGGMPKQKAIEFSDVQRQLEKADGIDVLLLMDCCYAARTVKFEQIKTMEVLAAVSREVTAEMSTKGSLFTTALTKHLQDCASQPKGILISELANLMHHDSILDDQSPQYIPLMGHHKPIVLQPLGPNIAPNVDLVHEDGGETSDEGEDEIPVSNIDSDTGDLIEEFSLIFNSLTLVGDGNTGDLIEEFSLIFNSPTLVGDGNTGATRGVDLSVLAVMDMAWEVNFIHRSIIKELDLSTLVSPLKEPLLFFALGGQFTVNFGITLHVSRIQARDSEDFRDTRTSIDFYVVEDTVDVDVAPTNRHAIIGGETVMAGGLVGLLTRNLHAFASRSLDAMEASEAQISHAERNRARITNAQATNQNLISRIAQMQVLIREAIQESA